LRYRLSLEETTGAGLRRIARKNVAHALAVFDDPGVPFPEQVHQLRTTCKKMRALLHLVGAPGGEAEQRFRDAARTVSAIRDRHVQAAWLDDGQAESAPLDDQDREAIRRALEQLRAGLAAMSLPPEDTRGVECLQDGFQCTLANCREALRRAEERPVDHRHHRLRKWTKYHWYQLRLLKDLLPAPADRLAAMRRIGEDLGVAQDYAVLEAELTEREATDPEALCDLVRRKKKLQKRSRKACRHWFDQPLSLEAGTEGPASGP
jgi:CHAD domain-containing protein